MAGDLAQKHAGLGTGVQELYGSVGPEVRAVVAGRPGFGQRVQHPVGELRRREHLVVGKVRDAGQHIRVAPAQRKAGLSGQGFRRPAHGRFPSSRRAPVSANSTVICWMAVWFSSFSRSGCASPWWMKWAFSVSRLARHTSCAALASSRMLPLLPGFSSRHCIGRFAEQRHVQQVRLAGVDEIDLLRRQLRRDQVGLDGVGVDAVVDPGQVAADVPAQLLVFRLLQALEFLDEVELEFDRHPGGEFEGDVLVGVGTAVPARPGSDADGARGLDPAFWGQGEAVQTSLHSNPVEFDGIEIRVVELLPDAQELQRVPVAQPVTDQVVGVVAVFVAGDVREGNVVIDTTGNDSDGRALYVDFGHAQLSSQAASSPTVMGG